MHNSLKLEQVIKEEIKDEIKDEKCTVAIKAEQTLEQTIDTKDSVEIFVMANIPQKKWTKRTVAPSDRVTRNEGLVSPLNGETIETGRAMTTRLRREARRPRRLQLTSDNNYRQREKRTERTVALSDRITRHQGSVSPFTGEIIETGPATTSRLRQEARNPRRLRIKCRYKDPNTGNTIWHRAPGVIETLAPAAAARNPWNNRR
ncbi:hypothetical protein Q9189_006322 [Teloschistes chrysophthalmus]